MAEVNMPNSTNEVTKNDAGLNLNVRPGDPDYKGNTMREQAAAKDRPTIHVTESTPTVKAQEPEKSLFGKIYSAFFPGDFKTAMKYVKEKIIGPDMAQLAFKSFTNMLSMMFFEKPTSGSPSATTQSTTPTSGPVYKHYSTSTYSTSPNTAQVTPPYDVKQLQFDSEADIERLVEMLNDVVRQSGRVTVADLLERCNVSSTASSERWGWYRITGYSTYEDSNHKFHLELPNMTYFR